MIEKITPVILTYNEAANIARTLEQLRWAREIVVVDSFSDDATLQILSNYPQVRLFQREFKGHADQWKFAVNETGIASEWIMGLDADFVISPELISEIEELEPGAAVDGYRAPFTFCISGRRLRSAILPPAVLLFRRGHVDFVQDGHAHKVHVKGQVEDLSRAILHDDRKSLSRWLNSQRQYAYLEAAKILNTPAAKMDFPDRIRRLRFIAPFAIGFYCLVLRGGILDGRAGWFYAMQRVTAELMLSLCLLEHDLRFRKRRRSADQNNLEPAEKPDGFKSGVIVFGIMHEPDHVHPRDQRISR